jgi:hypothetical protein
MSDDTNTPAGGETGTENAPDYTEKAKEAGWKPLEEYAGDPDQWIDAKEFVRRAPLYEKNHKLGKKVQDLEKTIFELKGHMGKVSDAAYRKAVADLTAQRDEAIDLGDKAQVKEIDQAIKDAEALKPAPVIDPAITTWEQENGKWFYADNEIADFGYTYMDRYLSRNPGKTAEGLALMEKAVKAAFPDKFENTKRKAPPAVEGGGTTIAKSKFTRADLSDDQRKVVDRFVRQGVMKEEEYIQQLVETGEIGGKK